MNRTAIRCLLTALALLGPALAGAQTFSQDFTQGTVAGSATTGWTPYLGACLTAGNGSGTIPACVGDPYYTTSQNWVGGYTGTLPDTAGNGALRLTNGWTSGTSAGSSNAFDDGFDQAGGIISNFTLPTNTGVDITFTAVSYAGNSFGGSTGSNGDGADGIGFFILDGTVAAPYNGEFDVGAFGGSLGYTCSNTNDDSKAHPDNTTRGYDGVVGGYVGLGIDEYGNFMNSGDNTHSGPGFLPDTIGLRGPGSINWYSLNALNSTDYPAPNGSNSMTTAEEAIGVQDTCENGVLYKWTGTTTKTRSGSTTTYAWAATTTAVADYPELSYKTLSGVTLAAESARSRPAATPITYRLTISQTGHLTIGYYTNNGTLQPVLSNYDLTDSQVYPLPTALRFGFAASTGSGTNIHEILCFQAGPSSLGDTSLGVNEKEASKIATGEQAFLAYYDPTVWTGDLTANNLMYNSSTQLVTVSATSNWDASCNLTGVATGSSCATTGQAGPITAQAPASRVMLTWNGTTGIPFEWSNLGSTLQGDLDSYLSTDPTEQQLPATDDMGNAYYDDRLLYLRGDRKSEVNTSGSGLFRYRKSVLGDIVDSNPTWVGPPSAPYTVVWKDYLYPATAMPENGTNSYANYISSEGDRLNVVYVGANDGFLHGFRAGAFDLNHNFLNNSTYPNDGQEVFAYMPNAVLTAIHTTSNDEADYSNPYYSHEFYVDATPDSDDLFYGGSWHTWLVGGLGPGGAALYALDVSNPANFSETNASSLVIGEWNPTNITCAGSTSSCGGNLGNTYGTPVIRRLHNGMWGVIFGNGYGSSTGDAGIYVMTIDPTSGASTFYYLSTGQTGKNDGIAYPAPADLDGDNVVDYVYAGDLKGNVWRFDLTNSDPTKWAASTSPIFTDPSGNPITTKVNVQATIVSTGLPKILVIVGTGRKIPITVNSAATYASGTQHLYGIWDSNMGYWNSISSVKYDSLTSPPTTIPLSSLQQQTLTQNSSAPGVYDDTSNTVCWADNASCSSTPQYGWYMALPNTNEQVIFNSVVFQGVLYVNTTIPPVNKVGACSQNSETGDTIAISATTGGVVQHLFPTYTDTSAAGQQTNGSGSPFIVLAAGSAFVLTQTVSSNTASGGTVGPFTCNVGNSKVCETQVPDQGGVGKRLTWTELR